VVEVGFSQLPDGRLQRNIRDISVRLAAEQERRRLVSAVDQTADSIWMGDSDGTVTYVNPAFTRIYGYQPSEIVGRPARVLRSGHHTPEVFSAIWSSVTSGHTWSGTMVLRRKDGASVEVEAVISPIHDPAGRFVGYVQADRDVTRERALERTREREVREGETISAALARLDPGAPGQEIAAAACAVINGLPGVDSTMAIAFDDVTGTILAAAGQLAPVLASGTPVAADRVAYLRQRGSGGPWAEAWRPSRGAGRWIKAITATGLVATAYAPLRGARGVIGVVGIGSHDQATAPSLVEHMPALASFASTLGALLAPALEDRRRDLEARSGIQAVLDSSGYVAFFQPIVNLRSGAVVGYEALSRFTDGTPADVKFTMADRAGLGIDLEVATMRAALEAAPSLPPDAYLSLNASPALIVSGKLQALLRGCTRAIVLEITEHVVIADYPALRAFLAAIVPTVRLAVDDAGAGYASLRHILELAPDFVKLDLALIRGIDTDPARQALLAGMGYFAVKRKIRLVAEGIETATELETLRSLGISYGQGYLLGRPQDGRSAGPWPSTIRA
jgi:PAS domain S-box-containing protein